jgi:hypothetical protein
MNLMSVPGCAKEQPVFVRSILGLCTYKRHINTEVKPSSMEHSMCARRYVYAPCATDTPLENL